jgi:hypothetical protein
MVPRCYYYEEAVLMEKLIDIANGLTDMDKTWFPILFLRPKKDEKITNTLVGILSVFYGITGSISLYLILKFFGILSGILPLVILSIAFVVGVFIIYRAIFAFSWNSRAERLQAEQGSFQA